MLERDDLRYLPQSPKMNLGCKLEVILNLLENYENGVVQNVLNVILKRTPQKQGDTGLCHCRNNELAALNIVDL